MTHTNIAKTLGWAEEPGDIQEGLYLQPAEAATIENALASSGNSAIELQTANARVEELTGQLATATQSLSTSADRVTELEAEVEKLKGSASGKGTHVGASAEAEIEAGAERALPRYDSPDHPANQAAARQPRKRTS